MSNTQTDLQTRIAERLNVAEQLAPVPEKDGTVDSWVKHYAALALAAYAAFQDSLERPGPELGYLSAIGTSATAAACALTVTPDAAANELWSLTPEAGALNGEWEEWLTSTLDGLGINPADLHPAYTAADFRSPAASSAATR